jgi:hypothetical protein
MTRDGDQITSNKNTTLQIKKDNSVAKYLWKITLKTSDGDEYNEMPNGDTDINIVEEGKKIEIRQGNYMVESQVTFCFMIGLCGQYLQKWNQFLWVKNLRLKMIYFNFSY